MGSALVAMVRVDGPQREDKPVYFSSRSDVSV